MAVAAIRAGHGTALPDEHVDQAGCCVGDIESDLARTGAGSGSPVTRRTSGAPNLDTWIAFIAPPGRKPRALLARWPHAVRA
jgi:hypothetical protein